MNIKHEVILYIKTPPTYEELLEVAMIMEDPVEDMVRKDAKFKKLELNPDDYIKKPEEVAKLLEKHKALIQRPILVTKDKAIIGRPKSKIVEFLEGI